MHAITSSKKKAKEQMQIVLKIADSMELGFRFGVK